MHKRRSIRLKEYDYSQAGSYFVTICVNQRLPRLGRVENGQMHLSPVGQIVNQGILSIDAEVGLSVVMPNHVHLLLNIDGRGGVTPPLRLGLGQIVARFKYSTTKAINSIQGTAGVTFWQRNYYERVVRNDREYAAIYDYIQHNPENWEQDEYR